MIGRCNPTDYSSIMIRSFKHKGLKELFTNGHSTKMQQQLQARALRRLDVLDVADRLAELDVPGFDFHGLRGRPKRYSIHVNGPYCITFEWVDGEALRVDLEDYH
jgi:toxin HigB-1